MSGPSIPSEICGDMLCAWPAFPGQEEEPHLCLGHMIEQADKWGLDVPDEVRAQWKRIANKIGFHLLINGPGQPFTAEDYNDA